MYLSIQIIYYLFVIKNKTSIYLEVKIIFYLFIHFNSNQRLMHLIDNSFNIIAFY